MNSPAGTSSPKFKNLSKTQRNSPIELKEKMRKNYKTKIQNCRDMLMNRFRGAGEEVNLRETLTDIYKKMFDFSNVYLIDGEEIDILEEIKNELIQEEFEWWLEEYDKTQTDIDWSSLEQENNVICPICQKHNLALVNSVLSCTHCKITVNTQKSLMDVKQCIMYSLEKHSAVCNSDVQFVLVPEFNETHICLICSSCSEMKLVV